MANQLSQTLNFDSRNYSNVRLSPGFMQMPRALPILKIVDIYNYFALKTVVVYFSFEMLSNRITY